MIRFMVAVMSFFMACFGVIIFLCACILGLCTLDYLFDSDIKGYLVKQLGSRELMKRLRSKVDKIIHKLDNDKTDDRFKPIEQHALSQNELISIEQYVNDNKKKGDLCFAGFAEEKARELLDRFNRSHNYRATLNYDEENSLYIVSYERVEVQK